MKFENETCSDFKDIINKLNNFFSKIGSSSASADCFNYCFTLVPPVAKIYPVTRFMKMISFFLCILNFIKDIINRLNNFFSKIGSSSASADCSNENFEKLSDFI
jgi:hypothetical protein